MDLIVNTATESDKHNNAYLRSLQFFLPVFAFYFQSKLKVIPVISAHVASHFTTAETFFPPKIASQLRSRRVRFLNPPF